jgi:hypothetical protein
MRLDGIRDLMRMEMPERWADIYHAPAIFGWGNGSNWCAEPALHMLYRSKYAPSGSPTPNGNYGQAKCLFLVVSVGSPEAMEQFSQSEIKVDTDGWAYFVDGWGSPIYFLRWAPGCSSTLSNGYSAIQTGDYTNDHDPFDTRKIDPTAFKLIPLIYSFGRCGYANVNVGQNGYYGNGTPDPPNWSVMQPRADLTIGAPDPSDLQMSAKGNITNHLIEAR